MHNPQRNNKMETCRMKTCSEKPASTGTDESGKSMKKCSTAAVALALAVACPAHAGDACEFLPSAPVGIGPALEARDVLAVLRQIPGYPVDLQTRACTLAGAILELAGRCPAGAGAALAAETLRSRRAWEKFQRICEAQGGMRQPPVAAERRPWLAPATGIVTTMDNRVLARVAKLAADAAEKAKAATQDAPAPSDAPAAPTDATTPKKKGS